MYEGHPAFENSEGEEIPYAEKHWFVFNFNDSIMAFVTWFTQLLCEYSPELAQALDLTSSWGAVAWYIFPAFYLVGVAILFEIFKAFTIEKFLALKEEADKEMGEAEEDEDDSDDEELGKEADEVQEGIIVAVGEKLLESGDSLQFRRDKKASFWKELKVAYRECLAQA